MASKAIWQLSMSGWPPSPGRIFWIVKPPGNMVTTWIEGPGSSRTRGSIAIVQVEATTESVSRRDLVEGENITVWISKSSTATPVSWLQNVAIKLLQSASVPLA